MRDTSGVPGAKTTRSDGHPWSQIGEKGIPFVPLLSLGAKKGMIFRRFDEVIDFGSV